MKGKRKDFLILATQAQDENTNKSSSLNRDEENRIKEALEDDYDCKLRQQNDTSDNRLKTLTPCLPENKRVVCLVDTESNISCINKFIKNKHFNDMTINNALGYLNFLTHDDNNKDNQIKRVGRTTPMTTKYLGGITFQHEFEVVEFSDIMATQFDVLLGTDIIPKLRIHLEGVAHTFPDDEARELVQFENINLDSENKVNPTDANYGTPEQRGD